MSQPTPEQVAEIVAAIEEDDVAVKAAKASSQALAAAQAHDAECQATHARTSARRAAASAPLLSVFDQPNEIRGLHPEPVTILYRKGDEIHKGTLHSIHEEVSRP